MAYTFTDHYRAVRWVLRADALVVGLGVGTVLLVQPAWMLQWLGVHTGTAPWVGRIGGSVLWGLALGMLAAAGESEVRRPMLLAAAVSNGLMVVSLLAAYLQPAFLDLTWWGTFFLLVVFATCLLTTVLPLPYLFTAQRFRD